MSYKLYKHGLKQVNPLNPQGINSKNAGAEDWLVKINQAWSDQYDRQEEMRQIFKQQFEEATGFGSGKVYTSRMASTSTVTMILTSECAANITEEELDRFEQIVKKHDENYQIGWNVRKNNKQLFKKPKVWIKLFND